MRTLLPVISVVLMTGCCDQGDRAMPAQFHAESGPLVPPEYSTLITMDDPEAPDHLQQDIFGSGDRRWTFAHPQAVFALNPSPDWEVVAAFTVVTETWNQTGPVTVSAIVNGEKVGSLRAEKPGDYELRCPVPERLLTGVNLTTIELEVNPLWIAPTDGNRLGVLLREIGFESVQPAIGR